VLENFNRLIFITCSLERDKDCVEAVLFLFECDAKALPSGASRHKALRTQENAKAP